MKGIVLRRTGKDKLTPGTAFLVGAASKTLATVVSLIFPTSLSQTAADRLHFLSRFRSPTPTFVMTLSHSAKATR